MSHDFPTPGTYDVTLTLTDADSCSTFGPFTSVNLPGGLIFSSRRPNLAHHLTVKGLNGQQARFAATVRDGVLTISLASAQTTAQVTIASPELSASKRLVNELRPGKTGRRGKHHRPVKLTFKLTFKLKLTDAARDSIPSSSRRPPADRRLERHRGH